MPYPRVPSVLFHAKFLIQVEELPNGQHLGFALNEISDLIKLTLPQTIKINLGPRLGSAFVCRSCIPPLPFPVDGFNSGPGVYFLPCLSFLCISVIMYIQNRLDLYIQSIENIRLFLMIY